MYPPHRRPRRLRAALLGLALLGSGLVAASLPASAAAGQAEGLDVSHYQGTIAWPSVAGAGKTFAFLKASQGTTYRDPTYATNRTNANAAGIPTGAYHFADVTLDPSRTDGAQAEADWFLSVAQPKKGDLPPVFDIETNNGLGQVALTDWAMTWLERVRQKTGIYPMVYTSPSGWNTRFGGSGNIVAESGYGLLWIAHWTTATSPTVPANNWAGNGWTFWQYTSKGTVPGISGRVDLDRYKAADVSSILLRQLTITKDFSSGKTGGVKQDGLGNFCNGGCTSTTRLSVGGATTTLAPQSSDPQTTWTWGDACTGAPTGGTCTLSMTADRTVSITYRSAQTLTVDATGTGNGTIGSAPYGISCTGTAGVESGTCSAPFIPGTSVTLTATPAPETTFDGWTGEGCTGTGTCVVNVDRARSVQASFTPMPRATLSLTRAGGGTGLLTPTNGSACATSCQYSYLLGTSVSVTATPASGSVFVGWTGDCVESAGCSLSMSAARSVTGYFALLTTRSVSIATSAARVSANASVTLSGTLTTTNPTTCPVGSKPVNILRAGTLIGTATSTSTGTWSYTMRPTATATYTAQVTQVATGALGDPVCGAATSSSVKVTVR